VAEKNKAAQVEHVRGEAAKLQRMKEEIIIAAAPEIAALPKSPRNIFGQQ
jgi:hypothetical protein